ncbi:AAA family ATPase [Ferroacidibacillus organovorans]|uniref:AAA family ATPase n=1 Tax=Ferroacidibacillus organovorans TaxID=1765683 RepID=A0A853KI03_9BACL|nr:MoxR family ATPase [Ferroacidibacillus organovorans]KYP80134.1 AAA family ATPase [Ferroacidibacillus organovorans]OAG95010.1 AAA family ATPase [Ferroacidibacillus organovorans]
MAQVKQVEAYEQTSRQILRVMDHVSTVIVGKAREIELCFVALLAKGHVLLEDVPGVGKTRLVKSIAQSLDCQFKRIQFTPDLLPSDVTGISIYNQHTLEFEYREGPIFSQIVLVDEINRTSPRTQAALLESLEERAVTFDGVTRLLPVPFIVLATQNPIEYEGTFPLPEAQLDRFLLKISLGYPSKDEEYQILERSLVGTFDQELEPVATQNDILAWQALAARVFVDQGLLRYAVDLVVRTRTHESVYLGVSPRGAIGLLHAAQALATLRGRDYLLPDDLKEVAPYVLPHRMILKSDARLRQVTEATVIAEILASQPVPVHGASFSAR